MKKFAAILLLVVFALTGCGGGSASLGEDFLAKAHDAVKEAYGADYLPSMEIDKEFLQDIYGIPMDQVEAYIAEGPMMTTHVDTFIGLRAKKGSADKLAQAIKDHKTYLLEESFQYPMNMPKIEAAEILQVEDYVFFIMLGGYNDNMEETEEGALKFAQEQTAIGVKAIKDLVK